MSAVDVRRAGKNSRICSRSGFHRSGLLVVRGEGLRQSERIAPGLAEALNRSMRGMAAPRKHPDQLREQATRMAVELCQVPERKQEALAPVAEQLGMSP